MERCAASARAAGAFEVTVAGRFAPRKYQAPPAIAMSAAIPRGPASTNIERCFGAAGLVGFACAALADFERIDPDRLGDVLELGRAEIADREIEPRLHLPIRVLGQTDRAGLGDAFQPRGDIDAVAHQIAVALLDHVAEMDADAKLDAALGRNAGVPLDHAVLHLDGAAHGVDHAAELDDGAVAGALDHSPVMHGDRWIDQIAAQGSQPRQDPVLVRASEPAVADDVRHQNRGQFPRFAHLRPRAYRQATTIARVGWNVAQVDTMRSATALTLSARDYPAKPVRVGARNTVVRSSFGRASIGRRVHSIFLIPL